MEKQPEITTTEKPKNPKRVEQGKKLAQHNKERIAREKLEKEERKKLKDQEYEHAFDAWKKQQNEPLTIQDNPPPPQQEKNTKIFLPMLTLVVICAGTFWYYHETKTEKKSKVTERSKFVDRLEKFQK